MRVVFLEDVSGVAQGGDVKEVKNGFARNYLIPKNLAVPATHNALQGVERLKKQAEAERQRRLTDMLALAQELDGVQVNIEMRAGASGRLYGSVTNIMVADELSKRTGRAIDRRVIEIAEPIRQIGIYDVSLRLHSEAEAKLKVLVYATGTDPTALVEAKGAEAEEAGPAVALAEQAVVDAEPGEVETPEAGPAVALAQEAASANDDEDEPN